MSDLPPRNEYPEWAKAYDRWLLWSKESEKPGQPLTKSGSWASWSDADSGYSFEEAYRAATAGEFDGIGVVLPEDDPVYALDLDGCLREPTAHKPKTWLPNLDPFINNAYIEFSKSGYGLHIFAKGDVPEWWSDSHFSDDEHEGVEAYENKFLIFTGERLSISGETPGEVNPKPFLLKSHKEIRGRLPDTSGNEDGGTTAPDSELDRQHVESALRALDPDMSHTEWVQIGFAVHDWDNGATGKSVFTQWSKRGQKWDRAAKETVEWIWNNATQGDGVTAGTLIHWAQENGWSYPWSDGGTTDADSQGGIKSPSTVERFREACTSIQVAPDRVATKQRDGETFTIGVADILADCESVADAILTFQREANRLDGTQKQDVVAQVVYQDLCNHGEFFKTPSDSLYYFHEPETEVYRVDSEGRRTLDVEFQALVWKGRYNLSAGGFSRNLGDDILLEVVEHAPERDVYQFAAYAEESGELYVSDFGSGYYAVTESGIEWRPNGSDVYFLTGSGVSEYEYLEPAERASLPDTIPGEREMWAGSGDPLMRMFGNRINYDENAALGPTEQRKQLYVHLHTLPFIDTLNARPIMAWVGEKGSGKTVIQRSIGRFIYGEQYTESIMPDGKDDFMAKVTIKPWPSWTTTMTAKSGLTTY